MDFSNRSGKFWSLVLGIAIVLSWVIYARFYQLPAYQAQKEKRDKNHAFTVGIIEGSYGSPGRGGGPRRTDYSFFVYGKTFYGSFSDETEEFKKGDKYFIKFQKDDPTNSELIYSRPTHNSVSVVYDSGWAEIPK
jgi:hypothetical protein